MTKEEFNLSEKVFRNENLVNEDILFKDDVKKFIKILKEKLTNFYGNDNGWCKVIDTLAGEKLK